MIFPLDSPAGRRVRHVTTADPSAIATLWLVIVLGAVLALTWAFRLREKLEY